MGVEVQVRPASSEAVHAQIVRGGLAWEGWEGLDFVHFGSADTMAQVAWVDSIRTVYHAAVDVPGIHAPEPRVSALVAIEGADDDGALDTPAAEPSP